MSLDSVTRQRLISFTPRLSLANHSLRSDCFVKRLRNATNRLARGVAEVVRLSTRLGEADILTLFRRKNTSRRRLSGLIAGNYSR